MDCFEQHVMQGHAQSSCFAPGLCEGTDKAWQGLLPVAEQGGTPGYQLITPNNTAGLQSCCPAIYCAAASKKETNSAFVTPQIFW